MEWRLGSCPSSLHWRRRPHSTFTGQGRAQGLGASDRWRGSTKASSMGLFAVSYWERCAVQRRLRLRDWLSFVSGCHGKRGAAPHFSCYHSSCSSEDRDLVSKFPPCFVACFRNFTTRHFHLRVWLPEVAEAPLAAPRRPRRQRRTELLVAASSRPGRGL